jgi:hypothetical protein
VSRGQPPVAGAIKWARGLFVGVKRTMACVRALEPEVLQGEMAQLVRFHVRRPSRQGHAEKALLSSWIAEGGAGRGCCSWCVRTYLLSPV